MPLLFEEKGVRFRYPDNWRLEREEGENGWTVSVQSPLTSFFLVSVNEDMPPAEEVAATALEALRSEYEDVEAEERTDTVARQPAVGHDVQFFSLDLTNTCWTRSFYTAAGTVLVMWQANDLELEEYGPVLRAMAASLEVSEE
jgi:hypothetical protein